MELDSSVLIQDIEYKGREITRILGRCIETIRRGFDRWDDCYAKGPGLYFVVTSESTPEFVEPMGSNRWVVEDCATVFDTPDTLVETAQKVAFGCDGAVVVHDDGTIEAEMARVKQLSSAEYQEIDELPFTGWMGARHMSALETSTRGEVLSVVTLSEEDGRMTVFRNGTFEDYPRTASGENRQIDD